MDAVWYNISREGKKWDEKRIFQDATLGFGFPSRKSSEEENNLPREQSFRWMQQ